MTNQGANEQTEAKNDEDSVEHLSDLHVGGLRHLFCKGCLGFSKVLCRSIVFCIVGFLTLSWQDGRTFTVNSTDPHV